MHVQGEEEEEEEEEKEEEEEEDTPSCFEWLLPTCNSCAGIGLRSDLRDLHVASPGSSAQAAAADPEQPDGDHSKPDRGGHPDPLRPVVLPTPRYLGHAGTIALLHLPPSHFSRRVNMDGERVPAV